MADKREVFTIVEDDASGEGVKLPARQEGDTPLLKNGVIGLSFKDSSGNLVLPQLDSAGRLPIVSTAGVCKSGYLKATPGALNTAVDLGEFTGALAKLYKDFEISLSCAQPTSWELVHRDDAGGTPVDTVIWGKITGPGDYGADLKLPCLEYDTSGKTGVQKFVLKGYQLRGDLSDMRGYVGAMEI